MYTQKSKFNNILKLTTQTKTNTNIMQRYNKDIITPPTLKPDIVLNVQNIRQVKDEENVPECRWSYRSPMGSSAASASSSSCCAWRAGSTDGGGGGGTGCGGAGG